jgi:hypothetical protein
VSLFKKFVEHAIYTKAESNLSNINEMPVFSLSFDPWNGNYSHEDGFKLVLLTDWDSV